MNGPGPLGAFLQARRTRLRPEDVGLRDLGPRRRVAGLRREELAQLEGVSVSYYARLEQGLSRGASPAADRLTALVLAAHHSPDAGRTSMEADHLTRTCGLDRNTLTATLDRLVSVNAVGAWTFEPITEDVSWDAPRK